MPVSTDTFRQRRMLHVVFAISSLVLLGSVMWLVLADYSRTWRGYQRQGKQWQTAMTVDAASRALSAQQERSLRQMRQQIVQLEAALPHDQIAKVEAELESHRQEKAKLVLPAATIKGEIGPKTQQLERAQLTGVGDVEQIRAQLDKFKGQYRTKELELARLDQAISGYEKQLRDLLAQQTQIQKQIDDLLRSQTTIEEKLAVLDPKGLAWISDKIRNAPLLDWFNPTEKVQQVVVSDIRTDLNFLTVETIDRCQTCHVNIDNPAFEENNLISFAERQLALSEGQDVDSIAQPVVLLGFWESAARLAGLDHPLDQLGNQVLADVNQLRGQSGMHLLDGVEQLGKEFDRIATEERGGDALTRVQWYASLVRYRSGIKQILSDALDDGSFKHLGRLYLQTLIQKYNAVRAEAGLRSLGASTVLLGHPRLDLYVDPESSHPMKIMGCTSCHEGSGQETDFHHAAHSPQDIWVDAQTGSAVPEFLLDVPAGDPLHDRLPTLPDQPQAGVPADEPGLHHEASNVSHKLGSTSASRSTHHDLKLTDPEHPAPFAPLSEPHVHTIGYHQVDSTGQKRQAVRQANYWAQKYDWHAVHYMDWEKPMHQLAYLQSSCNKCHTEVFDIRDEAPRLFEGRLLFGQLGCVNCHAVEGLEDDLDIKKVGPSLAHLKHKLTAPMVASWIWAPKAFRPTTKMPHYFMLENNSSPVDILRTRVEVAAMTRYLMTAEPADDSGIYQGEPAPDGLTGDPVVGKRLFNTTGCLACHSNLDEHGQAWITDDLVARQGIAKDEAGQQYQAMSYNQRHWYVMEHLPAKLEKTGPELSGVGTKLKAGRDPEMAVQEATAWLYDWLRNPRHYASYTIMPRFRLSPQEASDLAAYLLTLERPAYEPVDFLKLDDHGQKMLAELVAQLKAAGGPLEVARKQLEDNAMSSDEQLVYLGKKMVAHYGCNGCHLINGFEDAASACTNLDDWGLKDPHKLDFGYFDHAFDKDRDGPITAWKVDHEGVDSDAPQVTHEHAKVRRVDLAWESMPALERRPWLYHKLHNPRLYDRGRTAFEGNLGEGGRFDVTDSQAGRPYDKLKMPKFFLTDQQVRSLVTFVTSIRKPLVSSAVQQAALDPVKMRLARGRQVATLYNCYGCHNIEGNEPQIWEFFDVFNDDGSFNYENLNNAPPRLIGQGSKTQPQWLHGFLQNVHELRPWLKIRMPGFALSQDHAAVLVDYFAGASQEMVRQMDKRLALIEKYRAARPDDPHWYTAPSLAQAVAHLKAFGMMADLVKPKDLIDRQTSGDEVATKWNKLLSQTQFLRQMNDVKHPFVQMSRPPSDPQWFARGEALFKELRCYQCHALGQEQKLLALWKLDNPVAESDEQKAGDDGGEEDDGYGDEEEDDGYGDDGGQETAPMGPVYTAPNLSYTATRLRRKWVDQWLQEPGAMQPGTKMPQWFPGGRSAFSNYPGSAKQQMHGMYGDDGEDQRQLLLDFIYEAGWRNYTPGEERLLGVVPTKVNLSPLPPLEQKGPASDTETVTIAQKPSAGNEATRPEPAQVAPSEPVMPVPPRTPQPTAEQASDEVSAIELQEAPTVSIAAQGKGQIVGVARFDGRPARPKLIRMNADAYCAKSNRGRKVFGESMVVNAEGFMQNVLVYVKSGLDNRANPPTTAAVMDQVGCIYRPHVLGLMAGQPLRITNSDHTLHNVKMASAHNGSFNEGMPVAGMELNKVLSKPELGITFKCDVHPWMGAFVHVLDNPFFCVSDGQGRFEIKGLPPGTYTLEAVHEKTEPVTFEVSVEADTSQRVDVTIK